MTVLICARMTCVGWPLKSDSIDRTPGNVPASGFPDSSTAAQMMDTAARLPPATKRNLR